MCVYWSYVSRLWSETFVEDWFFSHTDEKHFSPRDKVNLSQNLLSNFLIKLGSFLTKYNKSVLMQVKEFQLRKMRRISHESWEYYLTEAETLHLLRSLTSIFYRSHAPSSTSCWWAVLTKIEMRRWDTFFYKSCWGFSYFIQNVRNFSHKKNLKVAFDKHLSPNLRRFLLRKLK